MTIFVRVRTLSDTITFAWSILYPQPPLVNASTYMKVTRPVSFETSVTRALPCLPFVDVTSKISPTAKLAPPSTTVSEVIDPITVGAFSKDVFDDVVMSSPVSKLPLTLLR